MPETKSKADLELLRKRFIEFQDQLVQDGFQIANADYWSSSMISGCGAGEKSNLVSSPGFTIEVSTP